MNELKFHWALPIDAKKSSNEAQTDTSGLFDVERLIAFCSQADRSPVVSLLTPFGFHMPDPFPILGVLSQHTSRIKFLIAYRPGLMSPTLFAQQMATLSQVLPHRLDLNVVAGFSPEEQAYYGDHLDHDARYARSAEFMEIVSRLWKNAEPFDFRGTYYDVRGARIQSRFVGGAPRVYLSGNSKVAQSQAANHSQCWLRYGESPEAIGEAVRGQPRDVGIRMSIVTGRTRREALERAAKVVANPDVAWREFIKGFVSRSDSSAVKTTYALSEKGEWLSDVLWTGAVPYRGGPALALVGDYDRVAEELFRYGQAGVKEFILSGWPTEDELDRFSTEVFPRVRRLEALGTRVSA